MVDPWQHELQQQEQHWTSASDVMISSSTTLACKAFGALCESHNKMTAVNTPVDHITTSLDTELPVNVGYIGRMQPRSEACSYQEASNPREQDSSIVDAVIQEIVHGGSCRW